MGRKNRKMMTLHGVLHPKSDLDLVYLSRQKGGRGLISFEMCLKAEDLILHGKLGIRTRVVRGANLNKTDRMPP